ncbi:MAG TPA: hypothetical protein VG963_16550 [Polyangiaceae bacterium]|nr:hypothetical protein [Polyangiaceae bacterium]
MKLGGEASALPVAVDLLTRLVTGAVGDPGFAASVGERERDERRARVVNPDAQARARRAKWLGTLHTRDL